MKTILIVEDDDLLMSIFRMSLELDGYLVLEAENGKIALEMLLELDPTSLPSCIILDIMMPIMDGNTFLNLISTQYAEQFGHIPIIVNSAHGKHQMTPQVAAKLIKPIALPALCEVVEKVLNKRNENYENGVLC